jgi:hypothetical protein
MHQMSYKRNCPNIKIIKEKLLKLHQCPVKVLETSIISFFSKTPQKTRRHHLSHNTVRAITSPPTSKQVNYSSRNNPRQPQMTKKYIP